MANPGLILLQGDPATWPNPATGKTAVGIDEDGTLAIKQHNGTVTRFGAGSEVGLNKQASSAGQVDVTVGQSVWTEIVTLTGAQRTIPIVIALTNVSDGARVSLKTIFNGLPAGSIIQVFSAAGLIGQIQTDGILSTAKFDIYGDDGEWVLESVAYPAVS